MPERTLVERVDILEQKVEGLETLPGRVHAVELQIVQLREEMHAGFSALRADFRGELQSEIRGSRDSLKSELQAEIRASLDSVRNELRVEIRASRDSLKSELQAEIRAGDEETRRYMRVLHEEVISRIATIGGARQSRRR